MRQKNRHAVPAGRWWIAVGWLAACSGSTTQPVPNGITSAPPPSVERQIKATTTDNAIAPTPVLSEEPHLAINPSPSVSARGRLLIFLPGTQGAPRHYTYILRAAATRGMHAIGLNYVNQTAMGTLCQTSIDPQCYWTARTEVIFGNNTPVPGQLAVTKPNGIINRVTKLLMYLKTTYPNEGWGQFLGSDGTVDWSTVVLAGHSQGGGHVGVLVKSVALNRAVYFSSPEDWNDLTNQPAAWSSSRPNVTPASAQYGFGADADALVPNAHASAHWDAMGLARPANGPLLADNSTAPFGNAHQLRTALTYNPLSSALTVNLRNHGITVNDTSTPVDASGRPVFDSNGLWAYLCVP